MKVNRKGQSSVLDSKQLDLLIQALPEQTHKPLAYLLRKTACRISEGRQLTWDCISDTAILFPAEITKGKLQSREVPLDPQLAQILDFWKIKWSELHSYYPKSTDFLFPGRDFDKPVTTRAFDLALRAAAKKLNLRGVSTHSFRRSSLTSASDHGVPLRHIQSISGHRSLAVLQKYLEVKDEHKVQAVSSFA